MINKYSKKQIEGYPKEVIQGACVEVNDENMEHILGRDDIGYDDVCDMVRVLRRSMRNAQADAKFWSEECQKVNNELRGLKQKPCFTAMLDKLIEEADE